MLLSPAPELTLDDVGSLSDPLMRFLHSLSLQAPSRARKALSNQLPPETRAGSHFGSALRTFAISDVLRRIADAHARSSQRSHAPAGTIPLLRWISSECAQFCEGSVRGSDIHTAHHLSRALILGNDITFGPNRRWDFGPEVDPLGSMVANTACDANSELAAWLAVNTAELLHVLAAMLATAYRAEIARLPFIYRHIAHWRRNDVELPWERNLTVPLSSFFNTAGVVRFPL